MAEAEARVPLYVRLAAAESRHLEEAVVASGKSKRQLVEDAVREHLTDDGLVVGRVVLSEAPHAVLTLGEAADLLRLEEVVVREAAARHELPGRQIGDRWRFSRDALLAWLGGPQSGEPARSPDARASRSPFADPGGDGAPQ